MKNIEIVHREILYQAIEKKNRKLTQAEIARKLNLSLSIVNSAVKRLEEIGAIEIYPRNFHIIDVKKILYYWASIRNLNKDVIYKTRVKLPVKEIEKQMPADTIFAAYTAFKFLFKDVAADYSEVYIYADEISLKEIIKRFPMDHKKVSIPNLIVLKKDKSMDSYGKKTTIANTFVDLWNIKEWYAKEFVKTIEAKLNGILE